METEGGGNLSIEREPFRLGSVLEDVVELMAPLADEAGVSLVLEPGPDRAVLGESARVHQVLANLIGNAVKFTPSDGRVSVCMDGDDVRTRVVVTDTGVGISPEHLETIFDPHVRVGSTHTPGAGLGLAIAQRIVEAHGGDIGVESTVDSGTRFWFTLPTHHG